MPAKDYYKILEVAHNASVQEIKRAYRQMAVKYHPDKNDGDPRAEDQFKEVLEAYQVLSDPYRRTTYNQQRWYRQSSRRRTDNPPITSFSVINKCRALNSYMQTLDPFHINHRALYYYIRQLLSESTLTLLLKENNDPNNQVIIKEVLQSLSPLPFRSAVKIKLLLEKLAGNDMDTMSVIHTYFRDKKATAYWQKYLPLVMLFITLLICMLIYIVSNG